MLMQVKISIIIPIYNAEDSLPKTLDSVLSQDLTEIEVLCVDDGSTDGTRAMLERYGEKDSRIKVLHQKNQNAAIARNNAMAKASGEFIAFMDADDWYPDEKSLSALYRGAVENDVDICAGSMCADRNGVTEYTWPDRLYANTFSKEGKISFREFQYQYGYTRCIFRRKMLQDNQILFPNRPRFQDPPFLVEAMMAAKEFYAITEMVYCYRTHKTEWTEDKLIAYLEGNIQLLELANGNQLELLHNHILSSFLLQVIEMVDIYCANGNCKMSDLINQLNQQVNMVSIQKEYPKVPLKKELMFLWGLQIERQLAKEQKKNEQLEQSRAYWIGRKITAPVRWVRTLLIRNKQK